MIIHRIFLHFQCACNRAGGDGYECDIGCDMPGAIRTGENVREYENFVMHIFSPIFFTEKLWRPLQCVPRGRASKVLLPRNGEVQVSGLKNYLQHLRKNRFTFRNWWTDEARKILGHQTELFFLPKVLRPKQPLPKHNISKDLLSPPFLDANMQ